MIMWMQKNLGGRVTSLGTQTYWSTIPIKWGPYAVKYKFEPKNGPDTPIDANSENYLRDELTGRLKRGALKWDVFIQPYTDDANTPIEDAVIVWNSPFVKVGELTIAQRDLAAASVVAEEERGDKFLWNPWHAPEEHRPLGGLQRARCLAYPASGKKRGMIQP